MGATVAEQNGQGNGLAREMREWPQSDEQLLAQLRIERQRVANMQAVALHHARRCDGWEEIAREAVEALDTSLSHAERLQQAMDAAVKALQAFKDAVKQDADTHASLEQQMQRMEQTAAAKLEAVAL